MSTQSLQELLGNLKAEHGERIDRVASGQAPENDFSGPPMPLTLEYRAVVDKAEYKPSKASGLNQFVLTYEIQEPVEFKGRKVQDYVSPTPASDIASKALADLFGALRADMSGNWGDDFEGFVKQFEGRSAVITLRVWGTENDRYSVRYINFDRGQTLSTTVKPPKAKTDTSNLRPDIVIPKDATPAAQTPQAPAVASPPLPTATPQPTKAGPNLPPGLK